MNLLMKIVRLSLSATALSALMFLGGCSQNTQAVGENAPPVAQAPQPSTPAPATKTPTQVPVAPVPPIPAPSKPPAAAKHLKAQSISWQPNFEAALEQARASQKPIMVDFFATWCGPCHFLADSVYTAPSVINESQEFISVQVDVDKRTDLAQKYQVASMPTIAFFDASGKEVSRESGVPGDAQAAADWLVGVMKDAKQKSAGTPA